MTEAEIIRALRLFHYDPSWRRKNKRGKVTKAHMVPMRALARQTDVSYLLIYRAVLKGWLSQDAKSKLEPVVYKLINGLGHFEYVFREGYEFIDESLEAIGGHAG